MMTHRILGISTIIKFAPGLSSMLQHFPRPKGNKCSTFSRFVGYHKWKLRKARCKSSSTIVELPFWQIYKWSRCEMLFCSSVDILSWHNHPLVASLLDESVCPSSEMIACDWFANDRVLTGCSTNVEVTIIPFCRPWTLASHPLHLRLHVLHHSDQSVTVMHRPTMLSSNQA